MPTPCNPPASPNNPQFDPAKQCPPIVQQPIHPYGIPLKIPNVNPLPWPSSGNPNATNPPPVPNPYKSINSYPGSPGHGG